MFHAGAVATELLEITRRIYEEDPENDPYDGGDASTLGYTAATIMELAYGFNIPVHVMWGRNKIDPFVPTRSQYETVALYIWGNHLFTIGGMAAKQTIAQQTTRFPNALSPTIIYPMCKHTAKAGHFVEWELYTQVQPGHFYRRNIKGHKSIFAPTRVCARSKTFWPGADQGINME